MSIKIVKGSYSTILDATSLSGNQTITLPNATGTVALTNQLAKVATSGSYNDLSNKPSFPASPNMYVTTSWRSGANWWRKWSNGWIEQGGAGTTVNGDGQSTLTFNTSFSNTNYSITMGPEYPALFASGGGCPTYGPKSNNRITVYNGGDRQVVSWHWYACGY